MWFGQKDIIEECHKCQENMEMTLGQMPLRTPSSARLVGNCCLLINRGGLPGTNSEGSSEWTSCF